MVEFRFCPRRAMGEAAQRLEQVVARGGGQEGAEDVPAARGGVRLEPLHLALECGDEAHERAGPERGHVDRHAVDGLQEDRRSLAQRLSQAGGGGGAEGVVGGIHRVGLAVGERHGDVDDREAEGTPRHRVARALFHGGDVGAGNRAALHRLREAEAFAARQGAKGQVDLGELARAARMLAVPVLAVDV